MRTRWSVHAFVDWDTARRNTRPPAREDLDSIQHAALRSFSKLRQDLAAILEELRPDDAFLVNFRLYHGWHRGTTPTLDYRAIHSLALSRSLGGRELSTAFASDLEFGNNLSCGGRRSVILDTLRRRPNGDGDEQKMVDTALAADLLDLARRKKHDRTVVAVVVADDDDLIPPAITASEWGLQTWIVRRRANDSLHVQTDGLIVPRRIT